MSRTLEIFVFGVIASAQLAVGLFLLERHIQSVAPAAPAHAIQTAPQGAHTGQAALQQSACTRFADYARQKGWDTGHLPAYGTLKPKPQEQVAYQDQGSRITRGSAARC